MRDAEYLLRQEQSRPGSVIESVEFVPGVLDGEPVPASGGPVPANRYEPAGAALGAGEPAASLPQRGPAPSHAGADVIILAAVRAAQIQRMKRHTKSHQ